MKEEKIIMKRISFIICISVVLLIAGIGIIGCARTTDEVTETPAQPAQQEPIAPTQQEPDKVYLIRLASQHAVDHPQTLALFRFEEIVEANSDGRIEVEIHPNNQLGSPESFADSLVQGIIEMALPGTIMAQFFENAATPELPFLFRDWDHVRKVFDGPAGEAIHEGMVEEIGVRALGMVPVGFRVVSSNRKIERFEDFQGLRLRVPNIPFYVDFANGIGANAIAMPLTEVFTALDQGVVDAQENPYATIKTFKFYEVQDYIVQTNHIFTAHGWYVNEEFYQSLPDDLKTIVNDSVKEAIEYCFEVSMQAEQDAINYLKQQGIEIVIPDEEFRQKLYDSYASGRENFFTMYPGSREIAEMIKQVQ